MEAPGAYFLFLGLFQLALLSALVAADVKPGRMLVLLVGLNGAYSLVLAAQIEGVGGLDAALALLDGPTALVILAFVAERYFRRPRLAWVLAGLGVAEGLVFAAFPDLRSGLSGVLLGSVPLYAGYAAVLLAAARTGARTDVWIALAFLPRAVELGISSLRGLSNNPDLLYAVASAAAGAPMLAAATVALAWVAARAPRAYRAPAAALFLSGLLLESARSGVLQPPAGALVNHVTLAFVRPALLALAFFPASGLGRLAGVGVAALGAAWAGDLLGTELFGLAGRGAALSLAAALGIPVAALGAWMVLPKPLEAAPQRINGEAREPQWQRLMLALRGSSNGPRAEPSPLWTQKELARATGVPVQRVSEFSETLNRRAERRLDDLVPAWRQRFGPGVPALVVKHRGLVPGAAGVQVYYRLTPAGEAVAEALWSRSATGIPAESSA